MIEARRSIIDGQVSQQIDYTLLSRPSYIASTRGRERERETALNGQTKSASIKAETAAHYDVSFLPSFHFFSRLSFTSCAFLPSFLPSSSCPLHSRLGHPSPEYQMTPERTFVSLSPERGALPPSLPPSLTHTLTRSLSSSLMQERTHHKTRALQTDRQTNRQWCPHLGSGYSIARQRACTSRLHETYS